MDTPENWVSFGTESVPQTAQTVIRYVCPQSQEAQLLFRFRGFPVDPQSGRNFLKILNSNPKMLLPSEIQSIQTIINNVAIDSDFRVLAARLESMCRRKVVTVQGRWWEAAVDSLSVYIAADAEGCYVQEIHFVAPKDDFASHLTTIKKSLASIQWKPREGEEDKGGIFRMRWVGGKPATSASEAL